MSNDLDRRVKLALDETRLLILGVQVLLGFQFQGFFQEGFAELSSVSQWLCVAGLALLIASVGMLIAPSMQHRLVEQGRSSTRPVRATISRPGARRPRLLVGAFLISRGP
jgi:Family of unknown function (DUF6328)